MKSVITPIFALALVVFASTHGVTADNTIPCVDVDPRFSDGCDVTGETAQCIADLVPNTTPDTDACEITRGLYCSQIPCYTQAGCDAAKIETYLQCTVSLVSECILNCGSVGNCGGDIGDDNDGGNGGGGRKSDRFMRTLLAAELFNLFRCIFLIAF